MAPPTTAGVNTSKLVGYAVLTPPPGVSVSKLIGYAALTLPPGVSVSKLTAYAVLTGINTNAPVWGSFTFPNALVNNAYYQGWDLAPTAASPTSYSIVSGSLPTGLSIASVSSTDQGNISGTPTVLGAYTFTIRATNGFGTADKVVVMNVNTPSGGGGSFVFMS